MEYIIAWTLVYSVCIKGNDIVCNTHSVQNFYSEKDCMDQLYKQNKYWMSNKATANSKVYCIRSSMPLKLSGDK